MKLSITLFLAVYCSITLGQVSKTKVLNVGTFHFNFPDLDVIKTDRKEQIDVLLPKYQNEIEDIVKRLAKFRPTIIAIEREPGNQSKYDSLYNRYLQGEYALRRNEEEQIGFRLAKLLGIKKLYCVDSDGRYFDDIGKVLEGKDSIAKKLFLDFFYTNPDTAKQFLLKQDFKTNNILTALRKMNESGNLEKDLGNYLIGIFKYETKNKEFFGPDFVTGWWFNRNLRIFRNIQKINAEPTDRILTIFGAGHMNILNILFKSSPEFQLMETNNYLK